jgi:hypothetical protein
MNIKAKLDENEKRSRYSEEDRFGLLVHKGGGMTVEEYLKLPLDTKKKVHRLFKAIRMLPDRALTSQVQDMIVKDLGMADYQRVLMMLFQGGYLTREKDFGHRVVHAKTEKAKTLSDEELAADIISKNHLMGGWPVSTRTRKKDMKPPIAPKATHHESEIREVRIESQALGATTEVPLSPVTAPNDMPKTTATWLRQAIAELDERDALMVLEMIDSLKAARQFFPNLTRKQFLQLFMEGGRYVEG